MMHVIDNELWEIDVPHSMETVEYLYSRLKTTPHCSYLFRNLGVIVKDDADYAYKAAIFNSSDPHSCAYLAISFHHRNILWWPEFTPVNLDGKLELRYGDLPDGYTCYLGQMTINNSVCRKGDDGVVWSTRYIGGAIDFINTDAPTDGRIPVVKFRERFYPQMPLLQNISVDMLHQNRLLELWYGDKQEVTSNGTND